MIGDSEQPDAPCLQPFSPAVSVLSLPACSLLNTLGLVLLFTAGLSPDRYAMECKFPALLWCWEAVYLLFGWSVTPLNSTPPDQTYIRTHTGNSPQPLSDRHPCHWLDDGWGQRLRVETTHENLSMSNEEASMWGQQNVSSHVHQPVCACACAPRLTAYGTLTHTAKRGHAAIGNLSLITAGTASRAILRLNLLAFWYLLTLYAWPLANVLPWI